MKKLISLFLSLILAFTLCLPAFAVDSEQITPETYNGYPLIIVRGISFNCHKYKDTGETVLKFEALDVLNTVLDVLLSKVIRKDNDAYKQHIVDFVDSVFSPIASDKEGNSVSDNIYVQKYPKSMANYPSLQKSLADFDEEGFVRSACEKLGAENVYFFKYDWRQTPLEIADELNAVVEEAKISSGKDKVNIVGVSMGGVMCNAYLYEYGYDSVNNMTYVSSAHNGTYVCGDAFAGNIVFSGDTLYEALRSLIGETNIFEEVFFILLKISGIFEVISDFVNEFIATNKALAYGSVMRDNFGTQLGMWSLCPNDIFDEAVDFVFNGYEAEYSVLLDKLDELRTFKFSTKQIIDGAFANGVNVSFIAGYNVVSAPIFESCYMNSDGVIETSLMSNFATVAPIGKTLDSSYLANCDKKLVSPDNIIDTSTAWYKECTWFIKGASHVALHCNSDCSEFTFWLALSEEQPTTYNDTYPQFMYSDENLNLYSW